MTVTGPAALTSDELGDLVRREGRLVLATLTRLTNDLQVAEDAVQDALVQALGTWARDGLPANPRAWLILAAKRRAIDLLRRENGRFAKEREAMVLADLQAPDDLPPSVLRDDQLRLIFTCCHPALSAEAQVALSLRVLCGLTVAEVARLLLVPEQTMAKRLTRARRKIADANIPYRVPEDDELPERLSIVATTVYLLFTSGYASVSETEPERRELTGEAIRLGRRLIELLPGSPALEGLLATMLLHESRLDARLDADGDLVLLADQDRSLWNAALRAEGIDRAARAIVGSRDRPDRFAVTAAIAACHALAARSADTDWAAIIAWYDVLVTLDPSPVVELNRAAAVAESGDPVAGLALVESLSGLDGYFWLHATRAELLRRTGRGPEAVRAAQRAVELTDSPAQVRFLRRRFLTE